MSLLRRRKFDSASFRQCLETARASWYLINSVLFKFCLNRPQDKDDEVLLHSWLRPDGTSYLARRIAKLDERV